MEEEGKDEREEEREVVVVGEEEEAAMPLAFPSITSSPLLPSPFSLPLIASSSGPTPYFSPSRAPLSDSRPTCICRHPHRPHFPVGEV